MPGQSNSKVNITIAVIGLLGTVLTAVVANWDKIFPNQKKESIEISVIGLHLEAAKNALTHVGYKVSENFTYHISEDKPSGIVINQVIAGDSVYLLLAAKKQPENIKTSMDEGMDEKTEVAEVEPVQPDAIQAAGGFTEVPLTASLEAARERIEPEPEPEPENRRPSEAVSQSRVSGDQVRILYSGDPRGVYNSIRNEPNPDNYSELIGKSKIDYCFYSKSRQTNERTGNCSNDFSNRKENGPVFCQIKIRHPEFKKSEKVHLVVSYSNENNSSFGESEIKQYIKPVSPNLTSITLEVFPSIEFLERGKYNLVFHLNGKVLPNAKITVL